MSHAPAVGHASLAQRCQRLCWGHNMLKVEHFSALTTGTPQLHQLLIISTSCLPSIIKVAQEDFLALIPKLAPPALGFAVPKHASVAHECTTSGDCSATRRERLDSFHSNGFTSPIPAIAHLYWRFNASRSASDRSDGFTGSSSLRAIQIDGPALIGRCCWLAESYGQFCTGIISH